MRKFILVILVCGFFLQAVLFGGAEIAQSPSAYVIHADLKTGEIVLATRCTTCSGLGEIQDADTKRATETCPKCNGAGIKLTKDGLVVCELARRMVNLN